jgi:hypothetical protein
VFQGRAEALRGGGGGLIRVLRTPLASDLARRWKTAVGRPDAVNAIPGGFLASKQDG